MKIGTDLYADFIVVLHYKSSGVDISSPPAVRSLRLQDDVGGYFNVVITASHVPRAS